jgi:hypothetical protein
MPATALAFDARDFETIGNESERRSSVRPFPIHSAVPSAKNPNPKRMALLVGFAPVCKLKCSPTVE